MPNHVLLLDIQRALVCIADRRVRDHDIEMTSLLANGLHRREVVLLVRRDEGDDVHLAWVRSGEFLEFCRGGRLARAGEDDSIGTRGEGGDECES